MTLAAPDKLFSQRIDFTADLRVVTALHVGSGDHEADDAIEARETDSASASTEATASSRVQVDARGLPYLPGSSIKGALRSLAAGTDEAAITSLFGKIKDAGGGAMGALIVYGASLATPPGESTRPHYRAKNAQRRTGIALSARTAIAAGRGTADRHKLFHAEEVVPGAVFRLRLTYLPQRATEDEAKARALLSQLLATMRAPSGFTMGRSNSDGAGRLRIENLKVTPLRLDRQSGRLVADSVPFLLPEQTPILSAGKCIRLRLTGDGPFFVNDWSYKKPEASNSEPHLKALFEETGAPVLPATSLMGVLRSRARWLAALDRSAPSDGDEDVRVIDLFGSTEQRSRLAVDDIRCIASGRTGTPTSIRIDRFSGGPIEGALFATKCVYDQQFEVTLRLAPPRGKRSGIATDDAAEDDEARELLARDARARTLLDRLLDDIQSSGLKLGHATNRGFGWFAVAMAGEDNA